MSFLRSDELMALKKYTSGKIESGDYKTFNAFLRGELFDFDRKLIILHTKDGKRVEYTFTQWENLFGETVPQLIERLKNDTNSIITAIDKSILFQDMIVFRGAANSTDLFKSLGIEGEPTLEKLTSLVGKTYSEKSFVSCSPDVSAIFDKKINFKIKIKIVFHGIDFFSNFAFRKMR